MPVSGAALFHGLTRGAKKATARPPIVTASAAAPASLSTMNVSGSFQATGSNRSSGFHFLDPTGATSVATLIPLACDYADSRALQQSARKLRASARFCATPARRYVRARP